MAYSRRRRQWQDEQDYIVAKRRRKLRRSLADTIDVPSLIQVPTSNQVIINEPAYWGPPGIAGTVIGEILNNLAGTWRWSGADWIQLIYGGG